MTADNSNLDVSTAALPLWIHAARIGSALADRCACAGVFIQETLFQRDLVRSEVIYRYNADVIGWPMMPADGELAEIRELVERRRAAWGR